LHANPGDIRILSFHRLQNDALSAGCGLHLAAWQPAINLSPTGRIEYLWRLVTTSNKRREAVCDACEPPTKRAAERFSPAEEDYSATIWIATEELTSACT
jgi:hypothetical protein